ncbi:L,D-transpeptidase family protein [Clostridium ganghwense]|uniref:L,D-transpeptidase family protein n=1 Tax=Clostridium ganghwense TaxID=312089 RepID=A0ABT4CTA4_9CLOT|nr:L,D-transpeptidase family protein [Clostridium ganghwense]MCY6371426.1 L,D-transpeptidase family protein [Clostridium ganghwense]
MIYYVRPGDNLIKIAKQFNIPVDKIIMVNDIVNPNYIFVGQMLIIPENETSSNPYSIEIITSRRILKLLKNGKVQKQYPVAVGKPSTPTPKGLWNIIKKDLWGNQFGGYFLQLSVPFGTYGIHGTNKPWSIGKAVSNGCIRMYSKDAGELYRTVPLGTPILIY